MGGSDCVYFPSIGYGALGNPLLKWFTLKSLRWATVLLPASEALIEYEYTYQNSDYPKQGYKYFDPGNKTPVEVIYNGISTDVFSPVTGIKRDQFSFLTICVGLDRRNFFLKGIDLFFEAARLFPSCKFVLVGKTFPGFQFDKPENVVHVQYVPHCNLPELMSASQFYCQLSMSEGFGVALAESMSCGCVPIVSNVGIMDQIVGESGYVLKRHDIGLLKQIIEQSANDDLEEMSKMARGQIIKSYNDNQRSDRLLRTIGNLVKKC